MTALGAFSSGDVLTAADLNAIATTSTTYTPTWASTGTQPTLGNGTLSGRYIKINKLVWVQIFMLTGSTTTYGTGLYSWSIPSGIPARSGLFNFMSQGVGRLYDPVTGPYFGHAGFYAGSTTAITLYVGNTVAQPTAPFTFTTNDEVIMTFTYEAA